MKQYIDKSAIVAEIKERIDRDNEKAASFSSSSEHDYLYRVKEAVYKDLLSFLNTLEVKEVDMPALDNGNMPIKRWKEACKAASCQANYRKSKGLTETCDDYFVDGVQWADEHPVKMEENNVVEEIDYEDYIRFFKEHPEYSNGDWGFEETWVFAQYCYTLGLKAKKGE